MSKLVKFVGTRVPPMRTHIVSEGMQVNSRGYITQAGTILELTDKEADILLGNISPVTDETGTKVITGFYVDGVLGDAGLTGEKWQEVTKVVDSDGIETYTPVTPVPSKMVKKAVPDPVVVATPA